MALISVTKANKRLHTIDRGGWIAIVVGIILITIAYLLPFIHFILSTLLTVFHEFGHFVFMWLFGYPALPTFDLEYGGGVTYASGQVSLLVFIIWFIFAAIAWQVKRYPVLCGLVILIGLLHMILYLTGGDEAIITAMGHGMALLLMGVFFYHALSNRGIQHSAERSLYVMIAGFIFVDQLHLFFQLATNELVRQSYIESPKGAGDLTKLAFNHFNVSIVTVAWGFFALTILTFAAAVVCHIWREYISALIVWRPEEKLIT